VKKLIFILISDFKFREFYLSFEIHSMIIFCLLLVVFAFYPEMSQIVSTASTVMAAASTTAAAAPIAATAASSEAATLANVIAALQAISSWDPYLVYGGIALGVYKSSSSAIEAIYERSCLEVEKGREAKAGENSSLISNFQFKSVFCFLELNSNGQMLSICFLFTQSGQYFCKFENFEVARCFSTDY
jgi:hypothetical protein